MRRRNWRWGADLHVTDATCIATATCYSLNAPSSLSVLLLFWPVLGPFRSFVSAHSERSWTGLRRRQTDWEQYVQRGEALLHRPLWIDSTIFRSRPLNYCFWDSLPSCCKFYKLLCLLSTTLDFTLSAQNQRSTWRTNYPRQDKRSL